MLLDSTARGKSIRLPPRLSMKMDASTLAPSIVWLTSIWNPARDRDYRARADGRGAQT